MRDRSWAMRADSGAGRTRPLKTSPDAVKHAVGERSLQLGPYQTVRELGRGGMGVVYLARCPGHARDVAVKVLLHADDDAMARFEREIEVAARIKHDGVARVLDAGHARGRRYYVMEYYEGETLRVRFGRGRFVVLEAVRLARELADALAAVHELGIVHRDVKPGNVILSPGGPR